MTQCTSWLANPFEDRPGRSRVKIGLIALLLIATNVAAWLWALRAFSGQPALLGMAFLAYGFGLRHAFDADHIAAIDNVVRKLMREDKQPLAAGLYFSLGHATIVVVASAVIAGMAMAAKDKLDLARDFGGVIGVSVSAGFLLILGLANLLGLGSTWRTFLKARRGEPVLETELSAVLNGQGALTRLLSPLFRMLSHSWQMYPVGFLFGLGFDTATEIGVLGIAASQAATGMSPWTILVFPALFTAGMTLMDTADSILMTGAYGWAFDTPIRKLWYNLTITGASVLVALCVGGLEALSLIGSKLGLQGWFWDTVSGLSGSLTHVGFVVVAVFLGGWLASAIVYGLAARHRPVR